MNLLELHEKYDSAKARMKWDGYARAYLTDIYPMYFRSKRYTATKILEIGIHYGGSCLAMREYFPKAEIVGADIELARHLRGDNWTRLRLVLMDQRKEEDLVRVGEMGPYDFIIEDGEHRYTSQKLAMDVLPQYLKPGGVLFIEDVVPRFKGHQIEEYARSFNKPGLEVVFHQDLIAVKKHEQSV